MDEPPSQEQFVTAHPAVGLSMPSYVLYRHFLGWVNSIGGADPKTNASNFQVLRKNLPEHVELADTDLQFLRSEALLLNSELQDRDSKAALIVAKYRKQAASAVQKGQPLPPVPLELKQLQQERTSVLVQHYVKMQSSLSTIAKLQLDNYLHNEFAPHVSIGEIIRQNSSDHSIAVKERRSRVTSQFE
jgi:hypothetical protein